MKKRDSQYAIIEAKLNERQSKEKSRGYSDIIPTKNKI